MKKNLIIIWAFLGILSWGIVFWWDNFYLVNSQPNIPWIYNPVSWFYEQRSVEEIEREIQQEKAKKIDYYSDNSFQKFLDDNHPLSANYSANDIVKINSDFTSNKSSNFMLRKKAAEMFEWMAWAFSNAFGFKAKLTINSAWRSPAYQRQLASDCSIWRCAKPGTSEHEAWLALDLWVNGWNIKAWSGKYYQWLVDNAHLYGFHNSYQRWMEVDGKIVEPWHWRYVWVELATILHDRNQSFAEYFYENIEKRK
jgi:D-alanyl-D-alanine carboxypeptidase